MASKLSVEVAPLGHARVFRGRSLTTDDARVFEDGPRLAREFGGVRNDVAEREMPLVSAVAACEPSEDGLYRYFMGDEVRESAAGKPQEGFEDLVLPAGTIVAVVHVPFRLQASAALHAAQARRSFYEDWLPASGYESAADEVGFSDVELYHYRRRRFRRARKMVLDLLFVIRRA